MVLLAVVLDRRPVPVRVVPIAVIIVVVIFRRVFEVVVDQRLEDLGNVPGIGVPVVDVVIQVFDRCGEFRVRRTRAVQSW